LQSTGLFTDPNELDHGDREAQRRQLLHATDWLKLGLAGE
jgi:hypothetical protein